MATNNADSKEDEKSDCMQQRIRKQTIAFQKMFRAKSTQSRNGTNGRYFVHFAQAYVSLPDTHPHLKATTGNEYIHEALLIAFCLAQFLSFMVDYHSLKGNKIECNLRAAHGFVACSVLRNGKNMNEYPDFKGCWDGSRNTDAYIDSARHEQALTFGSAGHVATMNIPACDPSGMYVKGVIRRKDTCAQNAACGVRTVNIWGLQEMDVSVHPSTETERAKARLLVKKTKTCNTSESCYITCECPTHEHDSENTRCIVTVASVHGQLKWADFVQYVQPKKPQIVYGELPYFRRLRFIDVKNKDKGTYFSA